MKKFLGIALFVAFGSATFANNTSDEDVLFNLPITIPPMLPHTGISTTGMP